MKRYFLVHDDDMPTSDQNWGAFSYIALDSHGSVGASWNLLSLENDAIQPNPEWYFFPSLYDSKTTLAQSEVPEQLLTDLGLTGNETAIEAVMVFSNINQALAP